MPDTALPDWETIRADNDFISLSPEDQLSTLDAWGTYVGGALKAAGANPNDLGAFDDYLTGAKSEIQHSSETRKAVRDLSQQGAFTGLEPLTGGELTPDAQRALSAPMMGGELLAAMGIPDVWGQANDKRAAEQDFADKREHVIKQVGDEQLGDLIIKREQAKAGLEKQMEEKTKTREALLVKLENPPQDVGEKHQLQDEERQLSADIEELAQNLGYRDNEPTGHYGAPSGVTPSTSGPIGEISKQIEARAEELKHVNNGVAPATSAVSSFVASWAKQSLTSAPARWMASVFDTMYGGGGKGPGLVTQSIEEAAKQQEQILAGRVPEGMRKAFVNPALHDDASQQLARGLGHMMDWKTPLIFAGTPGLIGFGLASAEQSYTDASSQTKAAGTPDSPQAKMAGVSEATLNGLTAAAWTAPTLLAYMGVGKAVGAVTEKLLPIAATPLTRAAVTLPANVAGNMAASDSLRFLQTGEFVGHDWIENAVPDVLFALHAATDGYKNAAKVEKLAPTMEAVAAGTHPDIILRKMIAESPAFPDQARAVARTELFAQQKAARQFLENAGRPVPEDKPIADTPEAAQAQGRIMELAAERGQIMRRLNDPNDAPQPGDVARLPELEKEMKGLVADALAREQAPPASATVPPAAPEAAAVTEQPPEKAPAPKPAEPTVEQTEATPLPPDFQEVHGRLAQQLHDAESDAAWAESQGPEEIKSADAFLTRARKEWADAMGQEGRGDVAENVRRKLASGEYEWSKNGHGLRKVEADEPNPATASASEAPKTFAQQIQEIANAQPASNRFGDAKAYIEPIFQEAMSRGLVKDRAEFNRRLLEGLRGGELGLTRMDFLPWQTPGLSEAERARLKGVVTASELSTGLETFHFVSTREAPTAPAGAQDEPAPRKIRRGFSVPYAPLGVPDMVDFVVEQGGIKLPKREDRKQEHDGAPHLPGVYRRIVSQNGKISADEMAQMLADHGLMREAHVPTMWDELKGAVEQRIRIRKQEAARTKDERAQVKEHEEQGKAFVRDAGGPEDGPAVHAESLAIGDTVEVGGEKLKVTEIDPNNGDVVLEDGKKYGIQVVQDGQVIYGEHVTQEGSGSTDFLPPEDQEPAPPAEAKQPGPLPKLRSGEKQGDLLSSQTEDLTLVGEKGVDHDKVARDKAAAEQAAAEAKAKQDREQTDMFTPAAEPAPAAEFPAELTAEQNLGIQNTVAAVANRFGFRNEAERDSAIAKVQTEVEARAVRFIKETGGLDGFSAATIASSRMKDAVNKLEAKKTEGEKGPDDQGWTQATANLDSPELSAQDPARAAATKDAAKKVIAAFDKFSDRKGSPADKLAVMNLILEKGIDNPTEIAREMGWMTGTGESRRPDATKATRILQGAKEDIIRETNLSKADVLGILPPGMAQMLADVTAGIGHLNQLFGHASSPGDWTDFRRDLLMWSARQQTSFQEVDNMVREARRVAPDRARRAAITDWLEAGGDTRLLAQRAAATRNVGLRRGYELAQSLTPEEIAFARRVRSTFDRLWIRAAREGLIDAQARRNNYVNHIWKRPGLLSNLIGSSNRRLSEYFRNAQRRSFDTFFHGEQQGYRPETKDVAKLLGTYTIDLNNALISRRFVRDLMSGTAKDGRPLVVPAGHIDVLPGGAGGADVYLVHPNRKPADARDYRPPESAQPALSQWLWHAQDPNGAPIIVRDDLLLHPEIARHFNTVFGKNSVTEWLSGRDQPPITRLAKGVLAFFARDVQGVVKQTMLGFFSPFHAVQEATHAIGHRVNPFWNLPRIDLTRSRLQRDAAAHGLMLQPDRASINQFAQGLGDEGNGGNLVVNAIRAIGRGLGRNVAGRSVERVAQWADDMQHWLFHQYIPALKMKTYEHMLERNRERYRDEIANDVDFDATVKYLSSTQANAAYGHLNYADLGRSQGFQSLLQMAFLAPDFLEARGRFVGQAAKAALGPKAGRAGIEQIHAIAFLAFAQWSAARILNKLGDDDWHFDAPFEIIHGDRKYRMRSVPEDLYSAFKDTRRFIYGRLSPVLGKGVVQGLTKTNYRGERVDFSETIKEILASSIPLTLQPLTRGTDQTSRENPVSRLQQLAGTFGVHITRYSPLPDVYKLAADWKEKQTGKDATETVYPESKYSKLRYALEDGDLERAGREWEELLKSDKDTLGRARAPYKVAEGFKESMTKPFTGSKEADAQFQRTLKGRDRQKLDAAIQRRQHIMGEFLQMHAAWLKTKKAAAPKEGGGG